MTALSRADGSVLLYVRAPGAGTVRAGAQGAVELVSDRPRRRGSGARRHALTERRGAGAHGKPACDRRFRTIAVGQPRLAPACGRRTARSCSALAKPYAARFAAQSGGLSATVDVASARPVEPTLRAEHRAVVFVRTARPAHASPPDPPRPDEPQAAKAPMSSSAPRTQGHAGRGRRCLRWRSCARPLGGDALRQRRDRDVAPGTAAPAATRRRAHRKRTVPVGLGEIGDIEFFAARPRSADHRTATRPRSLPGIWAYNGAEWHEIADRCGATERTHRVGRPE